jgi:Phage integrase family
MNDSFELPVTAVEADLIVALDGFEGPIDLLLSLGRIVNWAAKALDAEIPGPKKLKWSQVIFEEKLGLERWTATSSGRATSSSCSSSSTDSGLRFALATSLRIEEIVSLTWPQVDFENREIRVIQKGGRPRIVPMTAKIEAILRTPDPQGPLGQHVHSRRAGKAKAKGKART